MRASRSASRDFHAAVFIIVLGLAAIFGSRLYPLGTLARMGAGYFPMLLGSGLTLVGLLMLPHAVGQKVKPHDFDVPVTRDSELTRARVRALAAIVGGMLVFILSADSVGFGPAVFLLTFITALGDRANSLKTVTVLSMAVTAAVIAIFYFVLGIQLPLFI